MHPVTKHWQTTLCLVYEFYLAHRAKQRCFFVQLFAFFIFINIFCYWWAIFTAFPESIFGNETRYYFKVQFPVGILGALFDSLSFFITIFIIKKSLKSTNTTNFISHLSLDFLIAILATFWVVFVFSFSGWIVSLTEPVKELLSERNTAYKNRVIQAVADPIGSYRNIYFGLIMGISAMIPTCTHIYMAVRSILKVTKLKSIT